MTVFAKCHHRYSYYPTEVGTVHPALTFDLLGAQIEALHARGIRAPIYVSILWDDLAGEEHTDWVITSRDGTTRMRAPLSDHSPLAGQVGWTTMDVATGYGDYVRAQVAELCDRYPVDGFFFDIVWVEPNYSPVGQRRLREAGVSLADEAAVHEHARGELEAFMTGLSELVRKSVPDATIFYNGIVDADLAYSLPAQTHIEVESLPTSGSLWGYTHYPIVARYARTLNKPILGMTGRFHHAWADFGGLKTASQLEYECGTIQGAGGAISVGDQLDPRGRLDPAVYRMVGQVFRRIRDLEPWLVGARPTAEVAILGAAERKPHGARSFAAHTPEVEGAVQMLLELGVQFDIVDPETEDLARYATVIVPDAHVPSATAAARLDTARRGHASHSQRHGSRRSPVFPLRACGCARVDACPRTDRPVLFPAHRAVTAATGTRDRLLVRLLWSGIPGTAPAERGDKRRAETCPLHPQRDGCQEPRGGAGPPAVTARRAAAPGRGHRPVRWRRLRLPGPGYLVPRSAGR